MLSDLSRGLFAGESWVSTWLSTTAVMSAGRDRARGSRGDKFERKMQDFEENCVGVACFGRPGLDLEPQNFSICG